MTVTSRGKIEHRSTKGWVVLDKVLALAGDAGAKAAVQRLHGSSPSAAEAAEILRATGAAVTRNSSSRWVADPHDDRVIAWAKAVAAMKPLGTRREEASHG